MIKIINVVIAQADNFFPRTTPASDETSFTQVRVTVR